MVLWRFLTGITPGVSFDLKSLTYFCTVRNNSSSAPYLIAERLSNACVAYLCTIIVDIGALY